MTKEIGARFGGGDQNHEQLFFTHLGEIVPYARRIKHWRRLLTGRFPLHLGYDAVIHDSEPTGVPLSMSLLPQALKAEGFERRQQKQLFYAPGLGKIDDEVMQIMKASDCVMIDGTLWTDNEMQERGVGTKTGQDMGHLHISGNDGSLHYLDQLDNARKVLIHINNTNPILNEQSEQAATLKQHGVEVAFDGMQIEL